MSVILIYSDNLNFLHFLGMSEMSSCSAIGVLADQSIFLCNCVYIDRQIDRLGDHRILSETGTVGTVDVFLSHMCLMM